MRAFAMHDVIVMAREIAFGALDLDDTRTGIGEQATAVGERFARADFDDGDTGQDWSQGAPPLDVRAHSTRVVPSRWGS